MVPTNYCYSKKENKSLLRHHPNSKIIRLKVFSEDVKEFNGKLPKQYQNLMSRVPFDDHRTFLRVGMKCIGFIVSPYNLNAERHKALELDGHKVIEMRQYYHPNAETIAVIQDEYVNCIFWKKEELK